MPTYYASFPSSHAAEAATSEILDLGVPPENISLVLGGISDDRMSSLDDPGMPLHLESDLVIDRTDAFVDPDREPFLHESPIGGGISTSTPDDDVSNVGEMDDGQSVAEDLMYPGGPVDRREGEIGDLTETSSDYVSRTDIADRSDGGAIKGMEFGAAAGIYAALPAQPVQDVGVILGSGEISALLLDSDRLTLSGALQHKGLPQVRVQELVMNLDRGGGLLAVVIPSGDVDEKSLARILRAHQAGNVIGLA
ncbi:MAG: hypothetical protein ACR2HJ_00925 [Fimbriimonadales bacterium]